VTPGSSPRTASGSATPTTRPSSTPQPAAARSTCCSPTPQYGVSYKGGTPEHLTIANDDLTAFELSTLLEQALTLARDRLRPRRRLLRLLTIRRPGDDVPARPRHAHPPLRQQLVWVKDRFVLGRADYHGRHESLLYGWRLDGEPQAPPHYEPGHDTILYGWRAGAAHTWEGTAARTPSGSSPDPPRPACTRR
jgi:hypothetical protein